MPSSWGLGILSHAGSGFDDDLGDSVDRIQFALSPLNTPIGPLVLVPMYELVATGVTSLNFRTSRGIGRYLVRLVSTFVCGLGYLWMLWDSKKQTWHDKVITTIMVKAE